MTDERLRGAARAAAQGDASDEARLLLERLRAGSITPEALELAAYCGHAAAREVVALGVEAPQRASDWIQGLEAFGVQTWRRALTWAAELALDRPAEVGNDTTPEQATAVRALVRSIHRRLDGIAPLDQEADATARLVFDHPEHHVGRGFVLDALRGDGFMHEWCEMDDSLSVQPLDLIAAHLRARFLASLGLGPP